MEKKSKPMLKAMYVIEFIAVFLGIMVSKHYYGEIADKALYFFASLGICFCFAAIPLAIIRILIIKGNH